MKSTVILLLFAFCPSSFSGETALDQLFLSAPVKTADEVVVPEPVYEPSDLEEDSKSVGPVTAREAVKLAKANIERALLRRDEYPRKNFWPKAETLFQAFDNKFDFRDADCGEGRTGFVMFTKKTEYYLSQSSSRKKNIIHICRGYSPDTELMAQDLIHEVSHLALTSFENEATELEMVLTKLGGGWPVISGYVSYNEGLTQEDLAWLGYDYLDFALGINSKLSYRFQILRANIVYDNFGAFSRNIEKAKDQLPELLAFRDGRGLGLKDMAISHKRAEFVRYIKELEASLAAAKTR